MSNINTLTEIVEKQWSRSINKKVSTAKKLITFKNVIKQKNYDMLKVINNRNISYRSRESSLIAIKKSLISYIGTWVINIQQNLITYRRIRPSLKYFINSEYQLLQPLISKYLNDINNIHYSDAMCCKHLFDNCVK